MVRHPILPDTSLAKWLPEEVLPAGMLDCEIFPRLIFYGSPCVPAQEKGHEIDHVLKEIV